MSYRPQITNRAGFARHAAPEAIAHHLAAATKAQIEATREVAWLTQLLEERQRQVAAGEWPPIKAEASKPSVSWRDSV